MLIPEPAFAYIDPGLGSLIFQGAIAAFVTDRRRLGWAFDEDPRFLRQGPDQSRQRRKCFVMKHPFRTPTGLSLSTKAGFTRSLTREAAQRLSAQEAFYNEAVEKRLLVPFSTEQRIAGFEVIEPTYASRSCPIRTSGASSS